MLELTSITTCAECQRRWLADAEEEQWRAYLAIEEDIDEPAASRCDQPVDRIRLV
jgi:hypothetical protein